MPPTTPYSRLHPLRHLVLALSLTLPLVGCPSMFAGPTPPAKDEPTAASKPVPLGSDTPITVRQPNVFANAGLQQAAGYHVAASDPSVTFETSVAGARVEAIPTTGGLTIIGTTDASGRAILRLDVNKVYKIIAKFKDARGQEQEFRTLTKVAKEQKDAPPTQTLNFASTLVTKTLEKSRTNSLASIDVAMVQEAMQATQTVLTRNAEALTAVLATTDLTKAEDIQVALQTISVVKQIDSELSGSPDPLDALSAAQTSVDATNSLSEGGNADASPPTVTPSPPPADTTLTKPETTLKSFALGPVASDSVYLPLLRDGKRYVDPAYPGTLLLSAETVLTNGTTIPLANWEVLPDSANAGKVSVAGGLLATVEGAVKGVVTVRATPPFGSATPQELAIQLRPTPRRVRTVQLALPSATPELYIPADGSQEGDNNLGHASTLTLDVTLTWNDDLVSREAAPIAWSTSTPGMVAVDADGTVRALPTAPEGTAVVIATTRTLPALRTEIRIPLRWDSQTNVSVN